jgi:hypothetical protein
MFCWKKSKKTLKICEISKQSLWFSIANTYNSYFFLNFMSHLLPFPCSLELTPFELSQITSSWSKQWEFKIQINKIPWSIFILIVHPKSYIHPTPLTLPLLYFGFYPQNPCKMRIFYIPLNMCFPYDKFVILIYTQTSGSIFTFCYVFLIFSPTNSICGSISKCCILDISSSSARIASTFLCS